MTDMIDIRDENYKTTKYVAIILFTIFVLCGIISNTLMVTVLLYRGKNNQYNREFVLIALQLIISHFTAFLPQMAVVLPELLQTKNNSYANETTWINRIFATFNTFSLFSVLHFSFLLALNRSVLLILPKYYSFFKSTKLYFLIAFIWSSGLAITFIDFYCCTRRFLVWNLTWEGNCTKSGEIGDIWWRVRYCWILFIPNAMFITYVAIFCNIRRKRHSTISDNQNQRITKTNTNDENNTVKVNRCERSMLIQAALNCAVLEIGAVIFHFMPSIMIGIFGDGIYLVTMIFTNSYVIFICITLPIIHFIYSKQSRDIIKYHLYKWLQLNNEQ
ncbi:hypothetical protein LOAG_00675 [Loa loa]|uniref:G-protein coupled receptors family 1 profile domain-containing protein n=1 Tax=Loa loa TaxID=7209 RepID=A0A1S0UB66_LOALO|nr:hypothetical protein LOAG_00675 [Loa loa]EFO27809.1 hypothetical protein LOAG_00675 [Loa loa]